MSGPNITGCTIGTLSNILGFTYRPTVNINGFRLSFDEQGYLRINNWRVYLADDSKCLDYPSLNRREVVEISSDTTRITLQAPYRLTIRHTIDVTGLVDVDTNDFPANQLGDAQSYANQMSDGIGIYYLATWSIIQKSRSY